MTRSRILAFGACCVLAAPLSLVACGGDGGNTDPEVVDAVNVGPSDPSVEVGQTVQLSATPVDESGDPLSRAVTWTSLNGGVATVSASGLVTGVMPGTASIRATSEGVNGAVSVTVTPRPVATVEVSPDSSDLPVGEQLPLAATTKAANNAVLTGRTIAWSTSNESVASVSSAGVVTANATGVATITATSEGVAGTAKVVVIAASPISIDSIRPALIVEGGTATIYGAGFTPTVAANLVTVDSVAASVTAATETTLQITMPSGTCRPARNASFRVSVGGSTSAAFAHAVRPASFLDMQVGEQVILHSPDALCLQFANAVSAEGYLIGVQSTSTSGASVVPARLTSIAGSSAGAAAMASVPFAPLPSFQASAVTQEKARLPESARARRLALHRNAELSFRERERDLLAQIVAARASRSDQSISASRMAIPPDAEVGDTVSVRVVDAAATNLCSTFFNVSAVVRVVGANGVWLTDIENPAGGYSDADLQALSDIFDNLIYATDVDYLGPPTDLDGNSRTVILTTRRVNDVPGMLGFVFSGDMLAPSQCAASNNGEIYYGIAPDPTAQFSDEPYSLAAAKLDAPALIAHEFAHILQNSNGNHVREPWEAEGQATFIEEVVGFAAQGRAPGNNYGHAVAMNNPATDSIDWYFGHIVGLATYFGFPQSGSVQTAGAPEQCSWLVRPPNGPCFNNARLVYDVPRSLLRYISDQFGPSHPEGEQGVQRDFLESTSSGYGAIEDATGLPIRTVLARWAASLYVDGRYANMSPALETSSWNMFDIFNAINPLASLTPRARGFASFANDFSVRGGSTAYFTVSGANRPPVAIGVSSQSGAALPASMQVWVVRVQ